MALWSVRSIVETYENHRLDSEYFRQDYADIEKKVKGFEWTPLGKVAQYIKRGLQPVYNGDGSIPVLRTVNIREEGFSDTRQEYVNEDFYQQNPRGQVYNLDILITSTGVGTLGRVTYVDENTPFFADGHISILRGITQRDPRFISVFLQSKVGLALIEQRQRGSSGQIEIYPDDLASIPIPKLDSRFEEEIASYVSQSRELRHTAKAFYVEAENLLIKELDLNIKDLSSQLTYIANSNEVMDSQRLDAEFFRLKYYQLIDSIRTLKPKQLVPLGDLLDVLTNGHTPLRHNLSIGEIPFLTAENIYDFRINFNTENRITLEHHQNELKRTQLHEGDLLVTIKGRIGNAVLVTNLPSPININQDIALLRLKPEFNPYSYFIVGFLNSEAGKLLAKQLSTGQINPFLGLSNLRQILIPLFDNELMKRLSAKIQEKLTQSRNAEEDAVRLLETAKQQIEDMIVNGASY
ncbi:MAG: restriction endonuclease subunit S [Chloroflexi bacterium]|uniref:Restriction endonuclease subunit S n=1 Tax=Candidatus Chlorohelix allophototropha TaxID=3003348 RepID=A0A8T7LYL7_9CHLR|nr:restriction endonuclease subunit S [Chloroflexota bacterium]WJW67907.1 restriction endonuclease subunit S [Chloroflexota bacterium L227-S17]